MAKRPNKQQPKAWQTTGHTWDNDIQEYNQPVPRWWLWAFYGTVVFAIVYWVIYPAWPIGGTWTKGTASVEYTVGGEQKESRWNTRFKLIEELNDSPAAIRQREMTERVVQADFETISQDPEMLAFVRSVGKGLFGDNCAACHGSGGQGVMGLFPNLADDAWLWGGDIGSIEQTLINGRNGYMPRFERTFNDEELDDVASYVLSLSGEAPADEAAARGEILFQGEGGGCYYCHGSDGKGLESQGAANLTDKIWTLAGVPGAETLSGKKAEVKRIIRNGVWNQRKMPAWKDRLSGEEIKLLALYVHQLGGGE